MGIFLLIVTFALFLLGNEILKGWIKINQKFPDKKNLKDSNFWAGAIFWQTFPTNIL